MIRLPLLRRLLLATGLAATFALAVPLHAQEVVVVPIGPVEDPDITSHLERISGPSRRVRLPVLVRGGRGTESRTIDVVGTLTNEDLEALVRLSGYYSQGMSKVVGDDKFAMVESVASCGSPRCSGNTRLTFRRTADGWRYLYKMN